METLRLDAGGPYLWRAGDIAIRTTTTVCERCDDVHVDVALFPDGDPDSGTPLKAKGHISLEPWEVRLDDVDAEMNDKLVTLFDKYKDEVVHRGERMLLARDRDLWRAEDLTGLNPSVLVRYRSVFPADFDLIYMLDDVAHYIEDFHCLIAGCDCGNAATMVTRLDDHGGDHRELGSVTLDLVAKPVKLQGKKPPVAAVKRLFQETDLHRRLMERRQSCRRVAPSVAQRLGLNKTVGTAKRRAKVGRNDPCPCGSGKKYKKCCLGKDTGR